MSTDDASLISSDLANGFKIVGKRRYMTSGNKRYLLPNDDEEIGRLDYQHYVMRLVAFGGLKEISPSKDTDARFSRNSYHPFALKNFRALIHGNFQSPIEERLEAGIRVLDLGTGTGIWSIEMAVEYPASTFVGTDVATVFPTHDQIPKNCSFVQANTLQLPFEDASFDFVYQRFMGLAFSPSEWKIAMKEIVRVLKPGGWIEIAEGNFKMERPPAAYEMVYSAVTAMTLARGLDIHLPGGCEGLLVDTGVIVDITADYISVPMGWHGRLGEICIQSFGESLAALSSVVMPVLGVDVKEYEEMVREILIGFREKRTWSKAPYAFGMKR
ncbi:S-adenosyl-L-methionine-dependent methyltransferase [Jimgerdemannia flammicorona]|uniref:S-adenosyl-L-methionine-dependent methyltransferase n=1 Tax=Jimgerdemannia flammicorona TaxID=994334 RepID=A0A433D9G0_9FUNG|nr:S-adenosyl-L-methionine-dependent methyltransferase [Jimgerdemannia flammicorona]